jgi:hypothetical protein
MEARHAALGFRGALSHDDIAVAPDLRDGFVYRNQLAFIGIQPIHIDSFYAYP